ncbi:hypothetical protein RR46_02470 [Papilio xuthus]|uniref:AP2/ERF domain-containing protein n=1 Tax=Papilio xuthus TaxID=66420 RepID=A0A194QGV5_PAPXU|nr:hypothetical protein RR46_02470 [Papilio xuthus]
MSIKQRHTSARCVKTQSLWRLARDKWQSETTLSNSRAFLQVSGAGGGGGRRGVRRRRQGGRWACRLHRPAARRLPPHRRAPQSPPPPPRCLFSAEWRGDSRPRDAHSNVRASSIQNPRGLRYGAFTIETEKNITHTRAVTEI